MEYSQPYVKTNHAAPRTIRQNPMAIVLNGDRSYFCGLAARIAANITIQIPKSPKISGTNSVQDKVLVATSSIANTRIIKKTPMESSCLLLSDIVMPA